MIAVSLQSYRSSDARLWLTALLLSLGINVLVVLVLALMVIRHLLFSPPEPTEAEASQEERVITIEPVTSEELNVAVEKKALDFARTSDDQTQDVPETPDFIGERDTVATSEKEPAEGPEELPSQDGIEPRVGEIETTESDYQDMPLVDDPASISSESTAPSVEGVTQSMEAEPRAEESPPGEERTAPKRERLAEGPLSVDRAVLAEAVEEEPKEVADGRESEREEVVEEKVEERPKEPEGKPPTRQENPREPGFRGFQRKTLLKGSISRQGRSSLDVKEGALGRYHAAIGRAIEKAWQRRVIQHRDLITPGVIRIQVVLDERGKVRSVGTVEEFGIGTIQKGFTHRAIREADLPAMPDEVRRELQGEPLELLYNFIF
ncbi:MAG: hypothetical protein ACQKBU_09745 [Verrucomicrobiales bacterium]